MDKKLNHDFIHELIACCLKDKNYFLVIKSNLKSNYLPDENVKKIWKEILHQYDVTDKVPSIGNISLALRKERDCIKTLKKIKRITLPDLDSTILNFENFIKNNRFVELYDKIGDLYNNEGEKGKDKAYKFLISESDKLSKFSLKNAKFESVFANFRKRNIDRVATREEIVLIPTGVDPIDKILDGGKQKTEFTLLLAESGRGKSQFLTQCGITAARLGHKVAHFQIEGTKRQCMNRYDSAWTGTLYRDIRFGNIEKKNLKKAKRLVERIGKGEIYVEAFEKFGEVTTTDIRNSLIAMIKLYGSIDTILIDYFELCKTSDGVRYGPKDEHIRQEVLAREFKQIAMEFNADVTSVTQTSSISPDDLDDPEFVITRFNLGNSKGKIRASDNFFTLNQTKDERKVNTIRVYFDKLREHTSGQVIYMKTLYNRSRFYDRKATLNEFVD